MQRIARIGAGESSLMIYGDHHAGGMAFTVKRRDRNGVRAQSSC